MRATFVRAALPAALFGAVLAQAVPAQDLPAITRKDLQASQNNLKQIGIAFHAFHDAHRVMPDDILGKDGKPILSWRVAILPYIEQDALYKQFKFDEAWDSQHNEKLIGKMPKIYAPVRVQAKAGETYYQVFTGESTLFGGKAGRRIPASIPDGTSRTGMVFEAGEPIMWTRPGDMPFDPKKELPKLGGLFDGDFHVAMCDGSVKWLKKNPDEKELGKLIVPNDGFVIDLSKLEK